MNPCEPSLKIKVSCQSKLLVVMWARCMTTVVILTVSGMIQLTALPESPEFGWVSGFSLCAWRPAPFTSQRESSGANSLCDLGRVPEHS